MNTDREEQSKSSFFDLSTKKMSIGPGDQSLLHCAPKDLQGTVVDGKYQILKLLGAGGMGYVYLAKHLLLDKEVALKTFKSAELDDEAKMRFRREAQAIAKLNHGNIIQVFDFGTTAEQVPYYTMEFLVGKSLGDSIKATGRLAVQEALAIFSQVCNGLSSAHKKGIVHRDMKPDNIFLTKALNGNGESLVKVVDFGIAALVNSTQDAQKLTAVGMIFGSPLYMSPEQSMGLAVTEQSDIYSCGCALFEALTGRPPFKGPNAFSTLLAHQSAPVPSLKHSSGGLDFPLALEQLLYSMLAKEPAKRIKTIDEVAAALNRIESEIKGDGKPLSLTDKRIEPAIKVVVNADAAGSRNINYPKILGLGFIAVTLVVGVALLAFQGHRGDVPAARQAQPKPTGLKAATFLTVPSSSTNTSTNTSTVEESPYPAITPDQLTKKLLKARADCALHVDGVRLTDSDFKQIAQNKWLKWLSLNNCTFDNNSLARIAGLKIVSLELNGSALTDAGVVNILPMKKLVRFSARETKLSGAGIRKLASIKTLSQLTLAATGVTDQDLASFAACKKLVNLDLGENPQLTSEAIRPLRHLPLDNLRLAFTAFNDAGLGYLAEMKTLWEIDCSRTAITVKGLKKFCPGKVLLKVVNITDCAKISPADKSALHTQFPLIDFRRAKARHLD